MKKLTTIIVYSIAVLSGIWLFSTFLEGIPSMANYYLDGDPESALILSFGALLGLFAPKVYLENLKKEQTKKEVAEISKKYFEK